MSLLIAGLSALVAGVAVYWTMRFRKLLPLERGLGRLRGHADDIKVFSLEVLGGAPASFPRHPVEAGLKLLAALHRLEPELGIFWIQLADGAWSLAAHRGWDSLRGPLPRHWEGAACREAFERGGLTFDPLGPERTDRDVFLAALAARGFRRVRLVPWGREAEPPGGAEGREGACGPSVAPSAGLLAVADASHDGLPLARLSPFIDLARVLASAMAAFADNLMDLERRRQSLQAELSDALQDLARTQGRLMDKARHVRTLVDVASALTPHSTQTQTTLSAMVSIVAKSLKADTVAFLLLDESTKELVVQPGAYGLESEEMLYRIPLGESQSSSVRVFASGEPFLTGDAQNDPRVISHYAKLWRIHSLMVIPLKTEERTIGVMRVGSFRKGYFSGEDLELMSVIAREAAVIVETAFLNRRLSDTAEQLKSLNRIKDEFVSTVSHEFKTPLTSIMGFLTVLLEGEAGGVSEEQKKFLRIALSAARRLAGLVGDLLDISRLESGITMDLRPQDFEAVARTPLESGRHQASEAGKTLSSELPEGLPKVLCDERWIALTLDNLISNAVKFTRPGGRIRLLAQDKGEFLLVTVADDGIGIPADDKERIFEKFYRASNRDQVPAPGTGLGLAIAKEIVSKHGGKIWFESEAGKGTKFYFILKVASRGAGAPAAATRSSPLHAPNPDGS